MFAKFSLVALACAALAVATPLPGHGNAPGGTTIVQCNTGNSQCCNTVQSASHKDTADILGLLGIVVQGITGQVGLGCTPISVVGLGQGANCAQQPVCCQGNHFNGLINVGCSPISL